MHKAEAWIVGAMLLLVFMTACNKEEDPLDLLLKELEEAAEARNVDPFEKRLALQFTGNDRITREEALATLRRYFAAYEVIKLDITHVERGERGNRLNFQVSFSGQGSAAFNLQDLLPNTATFNFQLQLVQEDDILKVQKAFWQEVTPGDGF